MTIFVSLGVDCQFAYELRRNDLRKFNLPFDWVVTYYGISSIVENDFRRYIPKHGSNRNDEYGVLYPHHSFPIDTGTFRRSIERFRNILQSTDEVVFVRRGHATTHHDGSEDLTPIDDILDATRFDRYLQTLYPNLCYTIIVSISCPCYQDQHSHEQSPRIVIHNTEDDFTDICAQLFKSKKKIKIKKPPPPPPPQWWNARKV
jgi:hypothetical protein